MDCRHILVEKHSDAVKILTSIKNGEIQFNEAARQHSIDKAGKCGLLGWMTKDQLDPVRVCVVCCGHALCGGRPEGEDEDDVHP